VADFTQESVVVGGGTITGFEQIVWVEGSNFNDAITVVHNSSYSQFSKVYGLGGDDTLTADYYTMEMYGGDGNSLFGGP
jgi:hypothetical protein